MNRITSVLLRGRYKVLLLVAFAFSFLHLTLEQAPADKVGTSSSTTANPTPLSHSSTRHTFYHISDLIHHISNLIHTSKMARTQTQPGPISATNIPGAHEATAESFVPDSRVRANNDNGREYLPRPSKTARQGQSYYESAPPLLCAARPSRVGKRRLRQRPSVVSQAVQDVDSVIGDDIVYEDDDKEVRPPQLAPNDPQAVSQARLQVCLREVLIVF